MVVVAAGAAGTAGTLRALARSCRTQAQYVADLDAGVVPSTRLGQAVQSWNEALGGGPGAEDLQECDPRTPYAHRPGAPVVPGVVLDVREDPS